MKKELIESVLDNWDITEPYIIETLGQSSEDLPRSIYRVGSNESDYVLKGFKDIPESTVISNMQAHLFLGNAHSLAPKLYPTKEGTYYIHEQGCYFLLMEYIVFIY